LDEDPIGRYASLDLRRLLVYCAVHAINHKQPNPQTVLLYVRMDDQPDPGICTMSISKYPTEGDALASQIEPLQEWIDTVHIHLDDIYAKGMVKNHKEYYLRTVAKTVAIIRAQDPVFTFLPEIRFKANVMNVSLSMREELDPIWNKACEDAYTWEQEEGGYVIVRRRA